MKRREFVSLLGGAAATWPLAATAQRDNRARRIGVLMNLAEDDPEVAVRDAAFRQGLRDLGWIVGQNLRIDYRWGAGNPELYRKHAAELVALAPEVILATAGPSVAALQQATRTVPIVFTTTIDPVGLGYVASLARPGGNATGFATTETGFSGKWLELLKEIAPRVTRVAVLLDPVVLAGRSQFAALQARAPALGMELSQVNLRDTSEMDCAISASAREANGGLIVTASTLATINRNLIVTLAAQYRLPAVYPNRVYATSGGLISYGPHFVEQYRQAAGYVDRILKGEKPADLPVQTPTRYETVLNLKTAKALGLNVPRTMLARADELIQ